MANTWIKNVKSDDPMFNNPFTHFLYYGRGDEKLRYHQEFLISIEAKISIVRFFYQELLQSLPDYQSESELLRRQGYVDGHSTFILVVKYETFLNSIYGLMENIAFVVRQLFPKYKLPYMFHAQKDRFHKDRTIDEQYADILDSLEWYDEIRVMRAEFTHFLSGILVSFQTGVPGYMNKISSKRKDTQERIEKKDISEHAEHILEQLISFLRRSGEYFLNYIDKDVKIPHLCGVTNNGRIGARNLSYNDMMTGYHGVCAVPGLTCPDADVCKARKE